MRKAFYLVIEGIRHKRCPACCEIKPYETDFYSYHAACKRCIAARTNQWRATHVEERREYSRIYAIKRRAELKRRRFAEKLKDVAHE
jgi:hypothetical protein